MRVCLLWPSLDDPFESATSRNLQSSTLVIPFKSQLVLTHWFSSPFLLFMTLLAAPPALHLLDSLPSLMAQTGAGMLFNGLLLVLNSFLLWSCTKGLQGLFWQIPFPIHWPFLLPWDMAITAVYFLLPSNFQISPTPSIRHLNHLTTFALPWPLKAIHQTVMLFWLLTFICFFLILEKVLSNFRKMTNQFKFLSDITCSFL